jgi:hypothetical protein
MFAACMMPFTLGVLAVAVMLGGAYLSQWLYNRAPAAGKTAGFVVNILCILLGIASYGRDPALKIMVASYGQNLAAKHARDFRTVVEAPWFRRVFPRLRPHPKRNTESEFMTTAMGVRKAVSLGGAVTGHGANILIIDDLMKADDARSETERQRVKEFYEQTLFSRLNDKQNGAIIAIQQRLHEDDLAGYLLAKGNFTHLDLKAIAEEDEEHALGNRRIYRRLKGEALFPRCEPLATLDEIRRDIGSAAFSAQYQQNPVPPDGNRLRWEWFGTYDERPPRSFFQSVVQSWDTAVTAEPKSDFSVCTTWGYRERSGISRMFIARGSSIRPSSAKCLRYATTGRPTQCWWRKPTPAIRSARSFGTKSSGGSKCARRATTRRRGSRSRPPRSRAAWS